MNLAHRNRSDPDPPILAFLQLPCFFVFRFSLLCLCVFPSFSRDFRGLREEKTLSCFGVSLVFLNKARVGGSGNVFFFFNLRLHCQSRTPEITSNCGEKACKTMRIVIQGRHGKSLAICDFELRFPSPKASHSFCGSSGDSAPSTRKSPAIEFVRFWCAERLKLQSNLALLGEGNHQGMAGPKNVNLLAGSLLAERIRER